MSIAFEEDEFSSEVGQCQKQRLVDILLHVMLADLSPFSGHQIGYLASFLARLLSRSDSVLVSRDVFSKMLDIVTDGEMDDAERDKRQEAVLDILQADAKCWDYFDMKDLEEKCSKACFFRVLERLFEKSGRTDDILDCYLQDSHRKSSVFTWLAKTRVSDDVLLEKMIELIDLNVVQYSSIILKYSDSNSSLLSVVLEKLSEKQEHLYKFLHSTMSQSHPAITVDMHHLHLELMFQFSQDDVVQYLSSKDNHQLYDVNQALELSNTYNLLEAKVYLFERQGRIEEAFQLVKTNLQESIDSSLSSEDSSDVFNDMSENVNKVVEFCQRASTVLSDDEREDMWCSLLQQSVQPLSKIHDEELLRSWRGLVRIVVSSMLGHVTNSKVVSIIINDPGYSSTGSWCEVKSVMSDILETVRYETRLLESTVSSIRSETVSLNLDLSRLRSRGVLYNSPVRPETRVNTETDTRERERVTKTREFLRLYNHQPSESGGGFESGSILKSDGFPLRLKPDKQSI